MNSKLAFDVVIYLRYRLLTAFNCIPNLHALSIMASLKLHSDLLYYLIQLDIECETNRGIPGKLLWPFLVGHGSLAVVMHENDQVGDWSE